MIPNLALQLRARFDRRARVGSLLAENCTSFLRSVTRDLARALSPHSRGCWSSVYDPRPFIPVPLFEFSLAACLSAG
jgi:hypothetical protein